MKTVYCPVQNKQVDGVTCLDICLVADHMMKESILDDYEEKIVWNEEQRQKCLHCQWHDDVK